MLEADIERLFREKQAELETCIRIWRFKDAPERFRQLSYLGGDEDWIAVIPSELRNPEEWHPLWPLINMLTFQASQREVNPLGTGYDVFICTH